MMHAAKKKKKPPWRLVSMLGEARATVNCVAGVLAGWRWEGKRWRVTNLADPLYGCCETDSELFDASREDLCAVDPYYTIPSN